MVGVRCYTRYVKAEEFKFCCYTVSVKHTILANHEGICGIGGILSPILNSPLDGSKWQHSGSGRLIPGKRILFIQRIEDWVAVTVDLDILKNSLFKSGEKRARPAHSLVNTASIYDQFINTCKNLTLVISWREVIENQIFIISSYFVCSCCVFCSKYKFLHSVQLAIESDHKTLTPMCMLLVTFHSLFHSVHPFSPFLIFLLFLELSSVTATCYPAKSSVVTKVIVLVKSTYLLTPWCRALLEKLIGFQLV